MNLTGRSSSENVEDRRRMPGGKTTMGIGGLLMIGVITWLMGGNPLDAVMQNAGQVIQSPQGSEKQLTPEEEKISEFTKQILAGTEDVWTKVFKENRAYLQSS